MSLADQEQELLAFFKNSSAENQSKIRELLADARNKLQSPHYGAPMGNSALAQQQSPKRKRTRDDVQSDAGSTVHASSSMSQSAASQTTERTMTSPQDNARQIPSSQFTIRGRSKYGLLLGHNVPSAVLKSRKELIDVILKHKPDNCEITEIKPTLKGDILVVGSSEKDFTCRPTRSKLAMLR